MAEEDVKKEEVSGPVPVSALPPEAQEQVKQSLEQQADKAPSVAAQEGPPQDDHTVQAINQALASIGASNLMPVLLHAAKTGVCALVDDLAMGIKTVDLGAASSIVNLLAGNVAAAVKAWVINFNYPRPAPAPSPYGPPQPQPGPYYPPQPGPAPQPYYPPQPQPGPAPTPYYPPQPQPGPAPAPPSPYYPPAPPQPTPQPGPTPPRPPGLDINVR
jgi:hypothetical protein